MLQARRGPSAWPESLSSEFQSFLGGGTDALTVEGTNGRFAYGAGGTSPTNTWGNTNYYVDPLYTEG